MARAPSLGRRGFLGMLLGGVAVAVAGPRLAGLDLAPKRRPVQLDGTWNEMMKRLYPASAIAGMAYTRPNFSEMRRASQATCS